MSTTFPVPRFPTTKCNPTVEQGTLFLRPWARSRGQISQLTTTVTSHELDWRRKAEILKYKQKGNSMTQAQRYARVATNTLVRRSQTFATQNKNSIPNYTNPNTHNLSVISGNRLELPNCVPRITYTYGADIPGPVLALTPVPNVPLTRYNPERRQYRGGEGGVQWVWYPSVNGVLIGMSGGRNR